MNEMSQLAERLQADIENVRIGMGADPRIGYHFIYPGCGYGGSCFPKDVSALEHAAEALGYQPQLLRAVHDVNQRQKTALFHKLQFHFKGNLKEKTIAVWGLSFKPNTDDLREAPSLTLLSLLWEAGAVVQAYDPVAMPNAQRLLGDRGNLLLCDSPEAALVNADALCILTEWNVFTSPDFQLMKQSLREPVIVDGRNIYDPVYLKDLGFTYYGMGRGCQTSHPIS
jgi:UDPglucose 6-dehydrogenase